MFEFDCDSAWDVSQEADSLNKSLFSGKAKKKRNPKAKPEVSKTLSSIVFDTLNRKIEVAEGCAEGKFDMSGKKCESPLTPIEASQIYEQANKKSKVDSGIKIEKVTNVLKESSETQERMNFVTNSSNTVKSTKSGSEAVLNVNVNKAGKKKKQKLGLASDKAESPDSVSVSPEIKKNKRKGDPVSTPEQKKKAKKIPESGKQNSNDIVSSQVKKKKRDKTEKRIKNGAENTEVQDAKNEINNVKDIKMFDPQKLLELQQRQKKLLQALERSGRDNENKDSSNMKEKKKKNKFKSSEIVTSKNQLHNTKSSIANVNKVEKSARTKSDLTHQTNKTSLKSQSQKNSDPGNSSSKKQSMWGEKASAMSSLAQEKLNAARFRYLNEQLYTCKGRDALQLFKEDRDAFEIYHTGFENQASKWPVNPVNVLIKQIKDKSPNLVIADFGCGDAKLAQVLPQKVHSFDLVALNPWVKACDMSCVPLQNESVDIAVFCLSLMGTNLDDYISEANRVLKIDGLLKIVEVSSRFKGLSSFLASVCSHGFQLLNKRDLSEMFYLMDFKKLKIVTKGASTKSVSLKPCLYKKR
ncbi:hypothetical protein RRG08_038769 [Elysia crispata]|uniref:Ribosomal RNA-processing protein 8 n=1 Tax=Elysia crispata TaxID=231223 RepID=A0AAE1ALX0_9GAST|nr:hypothetical protein RRG08_038769 [Elysia crispata]